MEGSKNIQCRPQKPDDMGTNNMSNWCFFVSSRDPREDPSQDSDKEPSGDPSKELNKVPIKDLNGTPREDLSRDPAQTQQPTKHT